MYVPTRNSIYKKHCFLRGAYSEAQSCNKINRPELLDVILVQAFSDGTKTYPSRCDLVWVHRRSQTANWLVPGMIPHFTFGDKHRLVLTSPSSLRYHTLTRSSARRVSRSLSRRLKAGLHR